MKISLLRFLTVGLVAVFLFGILTAGALWYSTHYTQVAIDKLTESLESAASSQLIQQNLSIHRRQALLKGLKLDVERKEQTDIAKKNLLNASENLARYVSTPKEEVIVQNVQKSIITYLRTYDLLSARGVRGANLYVSLTEEFYKTQAAVQELTKFNLDEAAALQTDAIQQDRLDYAFIVTAFTLLSIALIILLSGIRRFFIRPVIRLNNLIQNYEHDRLPPSQSPQGAEEIQTIWRSFADLSARLTRQKDAQLTFLTSIAHDLKNPLGAIKMSTDLLAEDASMTPQSREMLKIVNRQTQHLSRLISDLLDTTQVESGHLELNFKKSDIRLIVQESALLHSSLSNRHKIVLDLSEEPVIVDCDEHRLMQVFNNLFSNALKYSPNGGKINAKVSKSEGAAIIQISDPGVGILPEDLAGIFEPFRRSSTTRATIPGIGLGLSISRKIVRGHHGGDISVSSQIGQGTTFSVRIPLHA